MFEALIKGIGTGFVLSWTFGTVFFVLIQTSLEQGWRNGMRIALGVIFSDLIFILVAVGLLSFIPGFDQNQKIVATVGGIILILLGFSMFFKKQMNIKTPKTKMGNFFYHFTSGVILNIINPVNFISWVVVSRTLYPVIDHSLTENIIFYTGVLGTIFSCETFISFSADKLKRFFTASILKKLNILMGIIFCGIGIYLLYKYNFSNEISARP